MRIGIIGGGASGMTAAIAALLEGADVVVYEQNDRVGKKILLTGNGKCNLSNAVVSIDCYHSGDMRRLERILSQVGVEETRSFFRRLGLMTKEKNGGIYPECEQASAVLDVLRFALLRLGAQIRTETLVTGVSVRDGHFFVHTRPDGDRSPETFDRIVLACGGRAGLARGCAANGLELASSFGLSYEPFAPALVQLRCGETFLRAWSGVRAQAAVTLEAGGERYTETGELQLTDYGVSGIPVFQLSRYASKAFQRREKALPLWIDFLPRYSHEEWEEELRRRLRLFADEPAERFLLGSIHKKVAALVLNRCGVSARLRIGDIPVEALLEAGRGVRHFPLTVTGVNPFENAQVCAGGVRLSEVTETLEARKQKGLYLTGELLDADGRCGGYNLQWAWTTGMIAGRSAAGKSGEKDD